MAIMTKEQLSNLAFEQIKQKKFFAEQIARDNYNRAKEIDGFEEIYISNLALVQQMAKNEIANESNKALEKEYSSNSDRINSLLKPLGITIKDLDAKYSCEICNDTGYNGNGDICQCVENQMYLVANKVKCRSFLEYPKLENFNMNIYKDLEIAKSRITFILKYLDAFPSQKCLNLALVGPSGTGKTYFAKTIARELIEKKFNVIVVSAYEINQAFVKAHTSKILDKQAELSIYFDCDCLVIDDLGTEPVYNNVTKEYFTLLINERIKELKPTIFTTNFTKDGIKARYDECFGSRIFDKKNSIKLLFDNEDIRN